MGPSINGVNITNVFKYHFLGPVINNSEGGGGGAKKRKIEGPKVFAR